jgi:alpha-glucosidase (family GH31 glycosyl hydrolase)
MMAHLLEAMKSSQDVGEYGRLTFAIVARHFMQDNELLELLAQQPGFNQQAAQALLLQVKERDYNPPKRERILEWQSQQEFQICPDPQNPSACNLYRELRFPQEIYDRIGDFWMDRAEAED